MTFLEKMKNGELYDCSFGAVPEELNKKLYECKELIHDFNMSRPSEVEYRDKIIHKVFALNFLLGYFHAGINFLLRGSMHDAPPQYFAHTEAALLLLLVSYQPLQALHACLSADPGTSSDLRVRRNAQIS